MQAEERSSRCSTSTERKRKKKKVKEGIVRTGEKGGEQRDNTRLGKEEEGGKRSGRERQGKREKEWGRKED